MKSTTSVAPISRERCSGAALVGAALGVGVAFAMVSDPRELEAQARTWLAGKVAALADDVAAEPLVLTGLPEAQLAEQSQHADLVVVGSRGYGPHRAVLLGSVSGCLVRDAACPVLVVPRGVDPSLRRSRRGSRPRRRPRPARR